MVEIFLWVRGSKKELHWECPEVLAAALVEARLDNVGHGGEVGAAVSVHDTLGTRGGAGSEWNGEHVILIACV